MGGKELRQRHNHVKNFVVQWSQKMRQELEGDVTREGRFFFLG